MFLVNIKKMRVNHFFARNEQVKKKTEIMCIGDGRSISVTGIPVLLLIYSLWSSCSLFFLRSIQTSTRAVAVAVVAFLSFGVWLLGTTSKMFGCLASSTGRLVRFALHMLCTYVCVCGKKRNKSQKPTVIFLLFQLSRLVQNGKELGNRFTRHPSLSISLSFFSHTVSV